MTSVSVTGLGAPNDVSKIDKKSYTVKVGYNLWNISKSILGEGATKAEIAKGVIIIAKLNSLKNPDELKTGQKLDTPTPAQMKSEIDKMTISDELRKAIQNVETKKLIDLIKSQIKTEDFFMKKTQTARDDFFEKLGELKTQIDKTTDPAERAELEKDYSERIIKFEEAFIKRIPSAAEMFPKETLQKHQWNMLKDDWMLDK